MFGGFRLTAGALLVVSVGACAVEAPVTPAPAQISVGGASPLAAVFTRVAAETRVPAALLAATSYVTTRFEADAVLSPDAPPGFAIAPDEISIRAAAALLATPNARSINSYFPALAQLGGEALVDQVRAALASGISGRDAHGNRVIVAAQALPASTRSAPTGMSADYAGASWTAASTSNYQIGTRGLTSIDHIVIHDTEGGFSGTLSWFKDPAAKVSAHYVVRSSDGYIAQMVAEKNIAWHDKCFNTSTIGIEHEGFQAHADVWYTEAMYMQSAKLTAYLADKYGIAKEHGPILGHGEAPDCSDHTDPGPGWDWNHYIDLVQTGGAPHFDANSAIVAAPTALTSGDVATVTVTLTNGGNAAWDLDATRLGTAEPADRDSAFFVDGAWPSPSRAGDVDARVAAGETGTFTFQIQAPQVTEPTMFDEAFQATEDGVGFFGPTVHVQVLVSPLGQVDSGPPSVGGGCNAGGGGGMVPGLAVLGLLLRRGRRRRV